MRCAGTSGGISKERTLSLLRQMLAIYSPSGKEAELARYLEIELKRRGLPVRLQRVDAKRHNLLVLPQKDIALCFVGHIDTVPSPDVESLVCTEKEGKVYGLGAADMKGGCAAMIEAITVLYRKPEPRDCIALALVVGEEENGDGTAALLEELRFPFAVVGEPTELRPCVDHHGYLEMTVRVKGRRRHASLADLCDNPVESLLRFTMTLIEHLRENHPTFTYNLRDLTSSQSGFAVPDWAKIALDIHVPPNADSLNDLKAEIETLHAVWKRSYSDLAAEIRFPTSASGYRISLDSAFVDVLKEAYQHVDIPFAPESFVSHSDANLLFEAGVTPVVLGPGSLLKAHAPFESVRTAEVVTAAVLYRDIGLALSQQA